MSKWEKVRLGDVTTVLSGSTPKTGEPSYWDGDLNWVTPAELSDETVYIFETERKITEKAVIDCAMRLMPTGTVLLSSRAPIGKVAIAGTEMYCNQGFKNMVCTDLIYNKYLFWYLRGKKEYLNSLGRGATFKEISKSIVEDILIPLPPLDIQKQIAHELDTVSELLALRKQQLKELDQLIMSVFYEMFGDPVMNEKGWYLHTLSSLSNEKLSYGSGVPAIDYDGETRYIRITDINDDGTLNLNLVSPQKNEDKYILQDGDILFARSGATVGKTLRYRSEYGRSIYAGYLIRMIPNTSRVLPDYIYYFTKTNYYNNFIESNKKTVAQPNINAQQFGSLIIGVPPLSLQNIFVENVKEIESQKALVKQAIDETQLLFDSLMSKYFDD